MISRRLFGNSNGKDVYAYTLGNGELQVTVIDFGASVQSIKLRGRELTLGYDELESYLKYRNYFGATVGRIANRVSGGKFTLNGKQFNLDKNDGENSLHGGFDGFDRRLFESKIEGDSVIFTLVSADGDQGLGGTLTLKVKYTLSDNSLDIVYEAVSDSDTLWNPTNHTFFNFSGTNAPVYDTLLFINAEKFTPVDGNLIPTGELKKVAGTPYDFTKFKTLGKDIFEEYEQLKLASGGYDQNFVLNGERAAVAEYEDIRLELFTDLPGLQLYTGNFLDGEVCRGKVYGKHTGFCLEPQYFPNAINTEGFESPVLRAGEVKTHFIRYKFV